MDPIFVLILFILIFGVLPAFFFEYLPKEIKSFFLRRKKKEYRREAIAQAAINTKPIKENGDFEIYHPNGELKQKGTQRNGKRHGTFERYDEYGILEEISYYEDGEYHGWSETDYGELKKHYILGKMDLEVTAWFQAFIGVKAAGAAGDKHPYGTPRYLNDLSELELSAQEGFNHLCTSREMLDGVVHGYCKGFSKGLPHWHENRDPFMTYKYEYKHGKYDGIFELYNYDHVNLKLTYYDGILEGPFEIYYADFPGTELCVNGEISNCEVRVNEFVNESYKNITLKEIISIKNSRIGTIRSDYIVIGHSFHDETSEMEKIISSIN